MLMLVLNNVVLPLFSEAVIDSNCIYNMFVSAEPVTSSYDFEVCLSEPDPVTDLCYGYGTETVDISFTPPFIYRYQCCATIIRNYVSVYTYMFVFTALQIPISTVVVWMRNRFPKGNLLHRLLGLGVHQLHSDTPYLNYPLYVAGLISSLAILVTFGAAFPPLALIILVAMIVDVNYVANSLPTELVPVSINDLGMTIYLVPFSAIFFSFFLFDLSNYQEDTWSSLWAPMIIIIMPILYFAIYRFIVLVSSKYNSRDDDYEVNQQVEQSGNSGSDPIVLQFGQSASDEFLPFENVSNNDSNVAMKYERSRDRDSSEIGTHPDFENDKNSKKENQVRNSTL